MVAGMAARVVVKLESTTSITSAPIPRSLAVFCHFFLDTKNAPLFEIANANTYCFMLSMYCNIIYMHREEKNQQKQRFSVENL